MKISSTKGMGTSSPLSFTIRITNINNPLSTNAPAIVVKNVNNLLTTVWSLSYQIYFYMFTLASSSVTYSQ